MKTFKFYFTISCIPFTYVILFNILLNLGSLDYSWSLKELLQLFLCTSLISLLMYFTDKLDIKTLPVSMLVDILDICAVMYIVGMGLFKLITPNFVNAAVTFGIIIAVYFFTFLVMMFDDHNTAVLINKKLQKINGDDRK